MELNNFEQLSKVEKINYLSEQIPIGQSKDTFNYIVLYEIDNFYAEVRYNKSDFNTVKILLFTSLNSLNKENYAFYDN